MPSLKLVSQVALKTDLTFKYKGQNTLAQALPVQNTWYTVLGTTLNARIIDIYAYMSNATAETLEVKVTIDGLTLVGTGVSVAGTAYFAMWETGNTGFIFSTTAGVYSRAFLIEGRSVKIEIRKTTANDTATLYCSVRYAERS
jgi:hypothetical protein